MRAAPAPLPSCQKSNLSSTHTLHFVTPRATCASVCWPQRLASEAELLLVLLHHRAHHRSTVLPQLKSGNAVASQGYATMWVARVRSAFGVGGSWAPQQNREVAIGAVNTLRSERQERKMILD